MLAFKYRVGAWLSCLKSFCARVWIEWRKYLWFGSYTSGSFGKWAWVCCPNDAASASFCALVISTTQTSRLKNLTVLDRFMHLIVYTSEYQGSDREINQVLADISSVAKIKNSRNDITGVLFYHNRWFLQILEARKDVLEELMSHLELDKRHKKIERLLDESIEKKSFSAWQMDSFNLDENELLNVAELKNIARVFKSSVSTRSDLLMRFYKSMLQSHALRDL